MKEFNRQGFLGKDFENYQTRPVAIIGISGGGSHVAQQLIHMGFSNLRFIDFDVLDKSNLTRMVLAKLEDVGKFKAELALIKAKELNPAALSKALVSRWQDVTDEIKQCEYIFSCLDRLDEREQLEMFCRKNHITMIDVGMKVIEGSAGLYSIHGQVFISRPGELCMRCFDFFNPKNNPDGLYGAAGPKPQVVFSNGILTSNAVNSFVKLISKSYGKSIPKVLMTLDSDTDTFVPHPLLSVLKKCPHF